MAATERLEIPADNMVRTSAFHSADFGFSYELWGEDAGMILTGPNEGINGDLHRHADAPHPTIVSTVDSIEQTVAQVEAHGGSAMGRIQMLNETGSGPKCSTARATRFVCSTTPPREARRHEAMCRTDARTLAAQENVIRT